MAEYQTDSCQISQAMIDVRCENFFSNFQHLFLLLKLFALSVQLLQFLHLQPLTLMQSSQKATPLCAEQFYFWVNNTHTSN